LAASHSIAFSAAPEALISLRTRGELGDWKKEDWWDCGEDGEGRRKEEWRLKLGEKGWDEM
jgi:hypothetical protein